MLRDQAENTMDMEVLDDIPMEDLNYETIQGYRNKSLMKMFNLISIGERSGSGVPNIFNTWADEGWKEPVIEERFDPDRTILTLEFVEKQAKKINEENKRRKQAKKTGEEKRAIILRRYMNILHNMVKVKQMILLHILV